MSGKITTLLHELQKACDEEDCQINAIIEEYFPVDSKGVRLKRRKWALPIGQFFDGLFYGYSICCVIFFVYHWKKGDLPEINGKRAANSGYVPCNRCYKKYER